MGCCTSCLRVILDSEPDVKINVIEPTSIGVNEHSSIAQPIQRAQSTENAPTLQVPSFTRPRRESAS